MAEQFIISVDGGSQSTKVFILGLDGQVASEGVQPLRPLHLADPVVALHPDDDLWDSLIVACRKALDSFPGKLSQIIGLGLCTIRCCRALLKADGTLAYPVLSWMDRRLSVPYEHTDPTVRYVTTTSGYITHRLTGNFKDTAANHEGMWPIDADAWDWSDDPAVLERFQIPREMLLDLVMPGDQLGTVTAEASRLTGIPQGLPVFATANDKAVETLGAGVIGDSQVMISLGTYIAAMRPGTGNVRNAASYYANMASIPRRYVYESTGGIRRGMWLVSWVRELLGDGPAKSAAELGLSTEDYLNRRAEDIPAGCEGLLTIPEFLAPVAKPYKRGVMIGFDGRHTGLHIYRSALEAIALSMYNNTMAMADELKMSLQSVMISGGGAHGELFMRIFADVFGLPSMRSRARSLVAIGCAICASVGLGVCSSFEEAAGRLVPERDVFSPNAENHELYQTVNNRVYREMTQDTDKILKKMFPIFGK